MNLINKTMNKEQKELLDISIKLYLKNNKNKNSYSDYNGGSFKESLKRFIKSSINEYFKYIL